MTYAATPGDRADALALAVVRGAVGLRARSHHDEPLYVGGASRLAAEQEAFASTSASRSARAARTARRARRAAARAARPGPHGAHRRRERAGRPARVLARARSLSRRGRADRHGRRARPDAHGLPQGPGRGRRRCRASSDSSSPVDARWIADGTDVYEVLGVSPQATDDEIKRAYRRLARECHPDANPDDPGAAERFKEINAAYEACAIPSAAASTTCSGPTALPGARRQPVRLGPVRPQRSLRRVLQRRRVRRRAGGAGRAPRARRRDRDGAHARRGRLRRAPHGRDADARRVRHVRRARRHAGHAADTLRARATARARCARCAGRCSARSSRPGRARTCGGLGTTIDHPVRDVPGRRPGRGHALDRGRGPGRHRRRPAAAARGPRSGRAAGRHRRRPVRRGARARPTPRSSAAATTSGTASRCRSCRPRSGPRCSSRRSTARRRSRCSPGTQPGARIRLSRAGRAVAAHRPARRPRGRGRRARPHQSRPRAGRAARAARPAARRGGDRTARGPVLPHPLGLPHLTRPLAAGGPVEPRGVRVRARGDRAPAAGGGA